MGRLPAVRVAPVELSGQVQRVRWPLGMSTGCTARLSESYGRICAAIAQPSSR